MYDDDGWNDVVVTDAHVDIAGCNRRLGVYRNLGGGGNVILEEQTEGEQCASWQGNPATCIVAGMPASELEGVHDVAIFDLDGDGWKDMVLGKCSGVTVLVNQTPSAAGGIPDGNGQGQGAPLMLDKQQDGRIVLGWSASCSPGDGDYAVYQGTIGDFTTHIPRVCSTGGSTTATMPVSGDAYFLVVPSNDENEGSYGQDSQGTPRVQSPLACMPQMTASCEE